jgi:hypothetical protein
MDDEWHIDRLHKKIHKALNIYYGVDKTTWCGAVWPVRNIKYYSGDQIKKNELGGACGTYGVRERFIQGFGGDTCGKETSWKT